MKPVVTFVLSNINKNHIVEINSKNSSGAVSDIANPTSLFSFGAGGNIISRGVTFNNLLSMYFTRGVKGKLSQDTYIQRARMFGARNSYKNAFQLWIPEPLMEDWSKCFAFHKLAIEAMRSNLGAPVWLADHKTTPTSPSSIDRSTVDFEGGEMSFSLFDYDPATHGEAFSNERLSIQDQLERIQELFSDEEFPFYLRNFLMRDGIQQRTGICFHKHSLFGTGASVYDEEEKRLVRRKKGIFSTNEFKRGPNPTARHHLKIFGNTSGKARLFYKVNGRAIKFIQNKK